MNKGPLRTSAIRFRIVFVAIDGASACLERGGRAFPYPARDPVTIANPYKSASATVFGVDTFPNCRLHTRNSGIRTDSFIPECIGLVLAN
jgi:hypothetical protein